MGLRGKLKDMAVADLIQHYCQDQKTARLMLKKDGQVAEVFFKDGNIIHARWGKLAGEEVIYRILEWEDGDFDLDTEVESPAVTITRSWSAIMLIAAKRLDEEKLQPDTPSKTLDIVPEKTVQPKIESQTTMQQTTVQQTKIVETKEMAQKLDEILKEMSGEIAGFIACVIVGMDGINVAQQSAGKVDPEAISAQLTLLQKLVDTTVLKLNAGILEDNLITTEKANIMTRFLPNNNFYLAIATNRENGNQGNMRLVCNMFAERIAKAMPH